jgi:hypothetical protein
MISDERGGDFEGKVVMVTGAASKVNPAVA